MKIPTPGRQRHAGGDSGRYPDWQDSSHQRGKGVAKSVRSCTARADPLPVVGDSGAASTAEQRERFGGAGKPASSGRAPAGSQPAVQLPADSASKDFGRMGALSRPGRRTSPRRPGNRPVWRLRPHGHRASSRGKAARNDRGGGGLVLSAAPAWAGSGGSRPWCRCPGSGIPVPLGILTTEVDVTTILFWMAANAAGRGSAARRVAFGSCAHLPDWKRGIWRRRQAAAADYPGAVECQFPVCVAFAAQDDGRWRSGANLGPGIRGRNFEHIIAPSADAPSGTVAGPGMLMRANTLCRRQRRFAGNRRRRSPETDLW